MRILSKIVLLFFLVFLTGPSVITIIDDSSDLTTYFDFSEEEEEKEVNFNEFKLLAPSLFISEIVFPDIKLNIFVLKDDCFVNRLFKTIFIPPPEKI